MLGASSEVKAALPYATAKKAMERERFSVVPSTSETISVIAENLEAGDVYPPLTQASFIGAVKVKNRQRRGPVEHVALILGDQNLIQDGLAGGITTAFVDATFRVTPRQARAVSKRGAQVTSKVNMDLLILGQDNGHVITDNESTQRHLITYKLRTYKHNKQQYHLKLIVFINATKWFLQVLSVVGDYMGRAISMFTVIMTTKKFALYKRVYEKIRHQFPEFKPPNFMTDFEWADRNALKLAFPRSRVWGCR